MIIVPFSELDYKSEKILKHFEKYKTLNTSQLDILTDSNWMEYGGLLKILLMAGYIQNADINLSSDKTVYQNGVYSITTSGRIYFSLRLKNRLYAISRSLIAPIVVSLITNLIIILLKD